MYSFQKFLKTLSSENDQFFIDSISFFREIIFSNYRVIQFDSFSSIFYLKKNSSDKFVPVLKDFKRENIVQEVLFKDFSYINNFQNFINNKYSIQSSIFENILLSLEKNYSVLLKENNHKHLCFHRAIKHVFRTNKLQHILFLKPYFLEHFNFDTGLFKQRNIEFFSSRLHHFSFSFYKSYFTLKKNNSFSKSNLNKLLSPLINKYPSKTSLILELFSNFHQKFINISNLIVYNSRPLFKNIMLKHLFNLGLSKSYRIEFEKNILFFNTNCSSLKHSFNCPKLYKTDTMFKHFFQIQYVYAYRTTFHRNPFYFYSSFLPLSDKFNILSFSPNQIDLILDYVCHKAYITNYLLYFLSKNYMFSFSFEDLNNLSDKEMVLFYLKHKYNFSFEQTIINDNNQIFNKNFSKLQHIKCHSFFETVLFSYFNSISYFPLISLISFLDRLDKRTYIIFLHIFSHLIISYLSETVIRKNSIPSYHILSEQILRFLRFYLETNYSFVREPKSIILHFKGLQKISNFSSKLEYFSNL